MFSIFFLASALLLVLRRLTSTSTGICRGWYYNHECAPVAGKFSRVEGGLPHEFTVLEYNIDKDGHGGDGAREQGILPIIELLKNRAVVWDADIILLAETLHCDDHFGAEDIAREFNMDFFFSVAKLDKIMWNRGGQCAVGTAVLSKYPFSRAEQHIFKNQWYFGLAGSPGRNAVGITIPLQGGGSVVQVATHLAAEPLAEHIRAKQAAEAAAFGMSMATGRTKALILGGDMNAPRLPVDPALKVVFDTGWIDSQSSIPRHQRHTCGDRNTDYIFFQPGLEVIGRRICQDYACKGWSDHVPIMTKFRVRDDVVCDHDPKRQKTSCTE